MYSLVTFAGIAFSNPTLAQSAPQPLGQLAEGGAHKLLASESQANVRDGEAVLRFEPYSFQTADGTRIACQLGRLLVPERHSSPNGRQIELAFVRINATTTNAGPPIVYLAGGPGGSGIALARGPRAGVILALREVAD